MSTTKIPKSKAKTAYGLLSEIATLALAEPLRLHMGVWKADPTDPDQEWCSGVKAGELTYPACNTVACIGGWAETLKPHQPVGITLGLDLNRLEELTQPSWWRTREGQTPEHARKAVAHIRRFQKKYRAQLLAKKV